MSIFKTYKFQELAKLERHLNGALHGGVDPRKGYGGIVGQSITFVKPAAVTYTFVAGTLGYNQLLFSEVKTQLEGAVAGLKVYQDGPELVLIETTPSMGIQLSGGTALPSLGFAAAGATSFVYSYPDGVTGAVAPHYVTVYFSNGFHVLVVKE